MDRKTRPEGPGWMNRASGGEVKPETWLPLAQNLLIKVNQTLRATITPERERAEDSRPSLSRDARDAVFCGDVNRYEMLQRAWSRGCCGFAPSSQFKGSVTESRRRRPFNVERKKVS